VAPAKRTRIKDSSLTEEQRGKRTRLDGLTLFQSFDVDQFLDILNNFDPPEVEVAQPRPLIRVNLRKESSLDQISTPWVDQLLSSMVGSSGYPEPAKREPLLRANLPKVSSVHEILRAWVDQWIDSARSSSSYEDPRNRSFKKSPDVANAVYAFSSSQRFVLLPEHKSLYPRLVELKGPELLGLRRSHAVNETRAQGYLIFFLLSDIRFTLAKCRKERCGKYFLLKQWNRGYKNGTICPDCKPAIRMAASLEGTSIRRSEAAEGLRKLVARRFSAQIRKTTLWQKNERLRHAIADFLNREIRKAELLRAVYKKGITSKWVARRENWRAIERLVQESAK
jgi:hypothetical protein